MSTIKSIIKNIIPKRSQQIASRESFITLYCEYIESKAHPKYIKELCGKCAKAVREAVEFALVTTKLERTVSAKNYGPSYEKVGFIKVYDSVKDSKHSYTPQRGDISIINYEPHGHITIYTGTKWISDYIQLDMYEGSIRQSKPPFTIYRFTNLK